MTSKKDKKRVDLDVRPIGPWFTNYDYTTAPADKTSPGGGLYMNMEKYKSVSDFRKKKRKENKKKKSDLEILVSHFCKLAGCTDENLS